MNVLRSKKSAVPQVAHGQIAGPLFSVRSFLVCASVLAFAVLFGGGGVEGSLNNGLIEAASALLIAFILSQHFAGRRSLEPNAAVPIGLIVLLLLVVAAQLIPVSPLSWSGLPGHDIAAPSFALANVATAWHPLSLDPERTQRFATALLPLVAFILLPLWGGRRAIILGLFALVGSAAVAGIAGALQLALDHPNFLSFYNGPSYNAASGFFANANHQSALMLEALVASGLLLRLARDGEWANSRQAKSRARILWAALPFFAIMAIASGSRAGVALLAVALPGALLLALGLRSPMRWFAAVVALAVILVLIVMFYPDSNTLALREAFIFRDDIRYTYLPDILYTLKQYWPVGSGFGTFVQVFAANETLDLAQSAYLNHAHDDLLEWLIEGGLPGAIWLALAAIGVLVAVVRALIRNKEDTAIVLGGAVMLLVLCMHSLIDYPLRTDALASIAGFSLGLIAYRSVRIRDGGREKGRAWIAVVLLIIGGAFGAQALRLRLVEAAVRAHTPSSALALSRNNGHALAQLADAKLTEKDSVQAEILSRRALASTPLDVLALRTLATALEDQKKFAGPVWQQASMMGWRDGPTQYWALRQAMVNRQYEIGALRADALMRTGQPNPNFSRLLQISATDPKFRVELIKRLEVSPAWRYRFLTLPRTAGAPEVNGVIATLRDLKVTKAPPAKAEAKSAIRALLLRSQFSEAAALDQALFGARTQGDNLIDDGNFSRPASDYSLKSTPFDWRLLPVNSTSAAIDESGERTLVLDTDGRKSNLAVERYISLAPGNYRLAYRVRADSADPSFTVNLICAGAKENFLTAPISTGKSAEFVGRSIALTVPSGCPLVRLTIVSLSGRSPALVEIDNVSLTRA